MSRTSRQTGPVKSISAKKSCTVDCRWQSSIKYMGRTIRSQRCPQPITRDQRNKVIMVMIQQVIVCCPCSL